MNYFVIYIIKNYNIFLKNHKINKKNKNFKTI